MSQAYLSVLAISFDVRGRLLIRQVHDWSADVFVAAICLRLLRSFFRGIGGLSVSAVVKRASMASRVQWPPGWARRSSLRMLGALWAGGFAQQP